MWLVTSELGRWQGMLLPPMIEGRAKPSWSAPIERARKVATVTHVLTHARMEVAVYEASLTDEPPLGKLVTHDEMASLAVPRITRAVLSAANGDDVKRQSRRKR